MNKPLSHKGKQGLERLAPPAGFEPATCGLTARKAFDITHEVMGGNITSGKCLAGNAKKQANNNAMATHYQWSRVLASLIARWGKLSTETQSTIQLLLKAEAVLNGFESR
jgi:hypothetical protein